MSNADIAVKRYANALWEAVGPERATEELASFEKFVALYLSSDDLQKLFSNPAFAFDDKKKVLTELASKSGFSKHLQNFLLLLLESGRISILGSICEAFKGKIMSRDGISSVKIETALPLTETQQTKILSSLEKEFSSKFVASVDIVPDLGAGIRLHFMGQSIDATLAGVLFQMKHKFLAEQAGAKYLTSKGEA
ncbi:MAG: ATP synthase F1 subunit delta [Bdellovibrionota bacterium]